MKFLILLKVVCKLLIIMVRFSGGYDFELRGWGGGGFCCYCLYLYGIFGWGFLVSFFLKYSKVNVKNIIIENYILFVSFFIIWLEGRFDLVFRFYCV